MSKSKKKNMKQIESEKLAKLWRDLFAHQKRIQELEQLNELQRYCLEILKREKKGTGA